MDEPDNETNDIISTRYSNEKQANANSASIQKEGRESNHPMNVDRENATISLVVGDDKEAEVDLNSLHKPQHSNNSSMGSSRSNPSEKDARTDQADDYIDDYFDESYPTMTFALFLYWVLPILLLSIFGRIGVDLSTPHIPPTSHSSGHGKGIQITPDKLEKAYLAYEQKKREFERKQRQRQLQPLDTTNGEEDRRRKTMRQYPRDAKTPSSHPSSLGFDTSSWPTGYRAIVNGIRTRRPGWHHGPPVNGKEAEEMAQDPSRLDDTPPPPTTTTAARSSQESHVVRDKNPKSVALRDTIQKLREVYERDRSDIFNALAYADAMRQWGLTVFDGGSYDQTAISVYTSVLVHLRQRRKAAQRQGLPTNQREDGRQHVASEYQLAYAQKSIDGLLCSVYTSLGKLYFMANMFELSEQVLSYCCDIEPGYLEALNARGSTRIVMGKYDRAAEDYAFVIANDVDHILNEAYTGLVRVLEANESSVPTGWSFIVGRLKTLTDHFESALQLHTEPNYVHALLDGLRRFHHALFVYNDKKTKDYEYAWDHLIASHKYKLQNLPSFPYGTESTRLELLKKVFGKDFWPDGMGSTSRTPIFVIGFARSGSTLLERILDAHPSIAGLGENSVLNGRLDYIRQRFVEASEAGGLEVGTTARELANEIADAMKEQWERIAKNTAQSSSAVDQAQITPKRFVDKMLTNYFNIGFIQMMFPKSLILHVLREPMDTVFSAFKHDFPSDRLAYTADEKALVELYIAYRDTMEHWEQVLPGRVVHVRYEDMVNDLPGMARAIIKATGLEWHDSVLDFHKQKHYVNTYSTTQVRKQVYKDAIKSWKRYEKPLAPLLDLVEDYVTYNQGTTLPNYQRPTHHDEL